MAFDLLSTLREGLTGEPSPGRPAGIEIRQDLAPAGGMPVQPPSYEDPLEIHPRYIDGELHDVVELDSVGSAANRLEEVLIDLHQTGRYPLPVSSTTVSPTDEQPITITTLEMPHRVFDAWLRLSEAGDGSDGAFEDSEHGRELSLAHAGALDALLETSAHDLLLGVWDSHRKGPHGQVRIGRSLTTTLIGVDAIAQARVAARRDPLNLGDASDLPKGAKKLSEQGLSSIPPQRARGGVAITEARYLGFLSFAALRRLGFERYDPVEVRVLLALLGLHALAVRCASGWDLRAQCALVAKDDPQFTLVGPRGRREGIALSIEETDRLLRESVEHVGITDRGVQLDAGKTLNGLVDRAIATTKSAA
ncbi:MAG TPA: type I-U CRISPR-associated RAMP protein Csb1/Cas7u [Solirubrobacteraceae bacterium]|jgi:CRISPR-associated protein Csb1|nr:type I-U CRISPR-associated RAMP protein Csb1/Cas7u [Solirubrobacteraceae bacterium]